MEPSKSLSDLTSAMEDYLEAIYHLEQERRIARVRDIANRLGVKMSSVSSALKILGSRGLISYDPHQYITLTDRGIRTAKEIVRKHEVLKRFLFRVLQVKENVAEDNACRIEHHLDPEVIEKLISFGEFIEMCPVDQTRWLEKRAETCEDCKPCLEEAQQKLLDRAKAQKAAIEDGMTLAEAVPGSQVIVESMKGTPKLKKLFGQEGLGVGAIVQVEKKEDAGTLHINIKGYHISLSRDDATKICVKPI
ncbi:MAG: metal-dependent transcriptional regulator [Desulfomonile tiedjei]|uniref:Transcriptional regulator MntR n=1 Tax=Desulfomonile tiedjei TaxID=2358 RepID=A0A9D6V4I5_9BACT|nr:metal-dependent transcriptional regulator [Desulfomonile tiedjei]